MRAYLIALLYRMLIIFNHLKVGISSIVIKYIFNLETYINELTDKQHAQ